MKALMYLGIAALTVFAAADCAQSTPQQRAGVPRWLWMVLIIVVPVVGPIIWILVSRLPGLDRGQAAQNGTGTRGNAGNTGGPSARGRAAGRKAFSSPDDDPEFLWRLEQQRREQQRKNKAEPLADRDGSTVDDVNGDDTTGPSTGPTERPTQD